MRNPFTSLPKQKPDAKFYLKMYKNASVVIDAIGACNNLSLRILNQAVMAMNVKNECEVNLNDLDNALRIKNAATRTKALNVLRFMNVIETTTCNRTGITQFRINARAFSTDTEIAALKHVTFNAPFNLEALDGDGYIIEEALNSFKARKPLVVKKSKLSKDSPFAEHEENIPF